jgi:hypothetical protein
MNWEAIGAVGEILGAIAVIGTLIYLAVQVRHSKKLLERNEKFAASQVYQARVGFRIDVINQVINPDIAELYVKWQGGHERPPPEVLMENFDNLSASEKLQVEFLNRNALHTIDNALYQKQLGLIDEEQAAEVVKRLKRQIPIWEHMKIEIPPRLRKYCE